MSWLELRPAPMTRVAIVAPRRRLRRVLVAVADAGLVDLDAGASSDGAARGQVERADSRSGTPRLAASEPDLDELAASERWDLLAGEAELQAWASTAVTHGSGALLLGWAPADRVDELSERLAAHGATVVELARPRATPPSLLRGPRLARTFRPLVTTYATVPYDDVDPTLFAAFSYLIMFGMMFGDVGHGLVLASLGLLLARSPRPALRRVRHLWPFPVAAGASAVVFGLLYGEFFGPTGVVPTVWRAPQDDPIGLIVVALVVGVALLAVSYALGSVNRWREGGPGRALYSASGIAGAALFAGVVAALTGWLADLAALLSAGVIAAAVGLLLAFVGFVAGRGGAAQAVIELFDTVLRLGANLVSFGRLAAFGLTHAAISHVVWEGASSLWGPHLGALAAIAVFLLGHAVAFALETIIIGVQALRLEYYELFSRVLDRDGRPFRPWHVRIASQEGATP